jgi:hypothetical protein
MQFFRSASAASVEFIQRGIGTAEARKIVAT